MICAPIDFYKINQNKKKNLHKITSTSIGIICNIANLYAIINRLSAFKTQLLASIIGN